MKFFIRVALLANLFIIPLALAAEDSGNSPNGLKKEILDGRPLRMIGMGLTQLMNDDYYIGAVYIDDAAQFSTGDDIVFVDAPRRMEFRFASDRKVSARGFGRKIAESIRINNDGDSINKQKKGLQHFMSLFKGNYSKGDKLCFDYYQTSMVTKITVNDKIIGEVQGSREMYQLLLNIWLGKRPPSSKFKEGIVGKNETTYALELKKRFDEL